MQWKRDSRKTEVDEGKPWADKSFRFQDNKGESLMMESERKKGIAASDDDEGPGREQETLLSIKLRRGFSVGEKGGPCTPSPVWKLEEDAGEEVEADAGGWKRKSVSARKLGANLWEVQDVLPVAGMSRKSGRLRRRDVGGGGTDVVLPFCSADRPQSASSLRRHVVASLIQHQKPHEGKNHARQPASPSAYSSSMEVTPFKPSISPGCSLDLKGRIGDTGYSLKTSTELLKVLNRIWSLEEQQASNVSVVKALKVELEHARVHIQMLMQEQKEHHHEMDDLMNQIAEDKLVRKNKEQKTMKAAVQSIREELDDERRLRRRSESLHHKLGKELSKTKVSLSKALKNLENERKSNALLEDLCDEFARGIGQYEKERRGLKKKYAKDCELNVDGLVLHFSEVWLDERLQMQMAESSDNQAGKDTIVSRLKEEIISFLQARRANNIEDDDEQQHNHNLRRQSLESLHLNGTVGAPRYIEDDDSIASDLHCFELNMDKTKDTILDQLKSHCEVSSSNLETARKSCSGRKTVGYNRCIKAKNSSMFQDGTELCNIINLQADANSGIAEADEGGVAIVQRSRSSNIDAMDGSNLLTHYAGKNHLANSSGCKVHHADYQGEISRSKFSVRGHCLPNSGASADFEISECSSKPLPQGLKENTLKAKLLEARLEGRHARLKAL